MDAIKAFFTKYHAVPAGQAGPQWDRATDAALLGWAADDCATWDADPTAHPHLRARMEEVRGELNRRDTSKEIGENPFRAAAVQIETRLKPWPPEAAARLVEAIRAWPR